MTRESRFRGARTELRAETTPLAQWLIRTFTSDSGAKPVDAWIGSLDPDARAAVVGAIKRLRAFGVALDMPHARFLGDGLWELRVSDAESSYRVIYFHWFGRTFGLLHGFTKTTRNTPPNDIATARGRRASWLARPGPDS
jgi:phage-related protein